MKRIIAAALLLCISFTAAFTSNYLIINKMNDISEKLKNLNDDLRSISNHELSRRTDEIISEWESSEWLVHAFISTESAVETERSLKMLAEIAKNGLTEEFEVQCIDSYTQIISICNSEKINKENIF